MLRVILLSGCVWGALVSPVMADVIEFQADGSIIKHEAVDYRNRVSKVFVPKFPAKKKEAYSSYISASALKYDVSKDLIEAVILVESSFNANATSHKGAMGLMQLMPATADMLGVHDAYDPEQNIEGGTKYLKQLLNSYEGDMRLALAAYNAGEGAVNKYHGVPPYKETQNYVKQIEGILTTNRD